MNMVGARKGSYFPAVIAATGLLAVGLFSTVSAQEFTINELSFEKGELEIQNNGFVISGAPKGDEEDDGNALVRFSHELSIQYAFSNYLLLDFDIGVQRLDGSDLEASGAGLEALFKLYTSADNNFYFGVFGAAEFALNDEDPNAFGFGTRFQYGGEESNLLALLNLGFEKTFGENREDGMEFNYGLILRKSVIHNVALGVEAFGSIENFTDAPPFEEQDHRIGPAIHFNGGGDDKDDDNKGKKAKKDKDEDASLREKELEWDVNLAVLLGVTEATPDTTFTWNVEFKF